MPSKILYLAHPGGGKSSSMRNLDPTRTRIINVDRKELPLHGWEKNYKTVYKDNPPAQPKSLGEVVDLVKSNYIEPTQPTSVLEALQAWEELPEVETITLDTLTHMITNDYVYNAIGREYSDYQRMGKRFFNVMDFIRDSKKNIIVFAHVDEQLNDMGNRTVKVATQGKMIEGFKPPSFFTTVLMGYVKRENGRTVGFVHTQSEGPDPAKSPVRFLPNDEVKPALDFREPNDLKVILEKLDVFRKGL